MRGIRRVRRQPLTEHRCPGACGQLIPVRRFACDEDWNRLPYPLRSRVFDTAQETGPARDQAQANARRWYADNPRVRPL